ncbi:MAG TPA: bifunctional phosphoglucose/phosphomannose isomerase [Thermaerobacter sp.]
MVPAEPVHLDDLDALRKLDRAGALPLTDDYEQQFRRAWALIDQVDLSPLDPPARILILGTGGGSAAAANLLRTYLYDRCQVPIEVCQAYEPPAFTSPGTLVLAISYSGNTEETLHAYERAVAAGAACLAVTAGGELAERAQRYGHPLIRVPGGLMPRMAIGYLFMSLLAICQRLGLIGIPAEELDEELHGLYEVLAEGRRRYGATVPAGGNEAKQIALALRGYIPVIYGLNPYTGSVAERWKRQLGENSKVMAFANVLPDVHHDEAVGWEMEGELFTRLFFVLLTDEQSPRVLQQRVSATCEVLKGRAGGVRIVRAHGRGRLARLFSLVHLGDYVSLYLALLRGIDPTPVPMIDYFKAVLSRS